MVAVKASLTTTDKASLWLRYAAEAENVMASAHLKERLHQLLFRFCPGARFPVCFVKHMENMRARIPTNTWIKNNTAALARSASANRQVAAYFGSHLATTAEKHKSFINTHINRLYKEPHELPSGKQHLYLLYDQITGMVPT